MEHTGILLSIAAIQLLAAASPGPSFAIVSNASASSSRRIGSSAAIGVLLATTIWVLFSAMGLDVMIARVPQIHVALQIAGAIYLVWLGLKLLWGARRAPATLVTATSEVMSPAEAIRRGFLTNIYNPKSIAYYTSIFVVTLPPDASPWLVAAAGATALSTSAFWWFSVALFFGSKPVRHVYDAARRWIDAVVGTVLIGLGIRLALSR